MSWQGHLEKIGECQYRIPKSYKSGMRVDGIVYTNETLLKDSSNDNALEQVANVAFLPGIVNNSLAMPDIHWGYGFPIGGVAATDPENSGVVSPGGVGYDINCGVRLVRTNLELEDVKSRLPDLVSALYNHVPSGVGSTGEVRVTNQEEKKLILKGAGWAVSQGMGVEEDLEFCEESGALAEADPDNVSERAYKRGRNQAGTLGSGNHFLEVQVVDEILDADKAQIFGLSKGQIAVMIHSGSRGFGYQICDDYVKQMITCLAKYGIFVPDRQLACAPIKSPEAQNYLGAMRCAANYAWANRQVLMYQVREVFSRFFGKSWSALGMTLVYDVAHNIAKFEQFEVNGVKKTLCVHRKGATRSLGPGHVSLPQAYKAAGQPVIIPGDMGRASYLLAGTKTAEEKTFGSTCHGAGRVASRHEALRTIDVNELLSELKAKGIEVRATGNRTIAEEAPSVYKDVSQVVDCVSRAGLAVPVARLRPLAVVKG
nr:Protein of unknown function UPF0027, homolog to rtcB from E. coli [uncultured bacterium]